MVVLFLAAAAPAAADDSPRAAGAVRLVMFQADGCSWCARWNREIGAIYDKTDEGHLAPLRRVDLDLTRPADLTFVKGVVFTPTFVLVRDGREVGRIVGYPGEEFFWPLLGDLLKRLEQPGVGKS
ncbi:MAG: hypothetical protein H6907_14265 [Hyphomicrobiales bacterium]|nr:hypothetical protein [Hyphomicrobiales bacterium]